MKYFVLWSGGLDSTYLIHHLLNKGHYVNCGYIEINNNKTKIKRELNSIKKLCKYFKKYSKFHYQGIPLKTDICSNYVYTNLKQTPILILSILCSITTNIDKVAMGFVMNDDAISYLEEIKNIYYSYNGLCPDVKLPEIEFPLIKTKKIYIIKDIDHQLLKNITFCESENDKDNCGECNTCKNWKILEENNKYDIPESAFRFINPPDKDITEIVKS